LLLTEKAKGGLHPNLCVQKRGIPVQRKKRSISGAGGTEIPTQNNGRVEARCPLWNLDKNRRKLGHGGGGNFCSSTPTKEMGKGKKVGSGLGKVEDFSTTTTAQRRLVDYARKGKKIRI